LAILLLIFSPGYGRNLSNDISWIIILKGRNQAKEKWHMRMFERMNTYTHTHAPGRAKVALFFPLIFFFVLQSRAEQGFKNIENFTPLTYNLLSQNWCIIQDARGIIYAANQGGILEYDGVTWKVINIPNNMVRALAVGPDGRIYVGGVNEIGFLKPDPNGELHYASLIDHLEENQRDFSDVYQLAASNQGVFFRVLKKIFRWHNGLLTAWETRHPQAVFMAIFSWKDAVYVQEYEIGLMQVKGDTLLPVPGNPVFARDRICTVLPYDDQHLLLGTRASEFYLYDDTTAMSFPTEANDYLKKKELYHGARLGDGNFALATLSGGVVIMDANGRLKQIFDKSTGLQDEDIKYMFRDCRGNLWLGLMDGISRIDYDSPLSFFDERSGLEGVIMSMTRHQGRVYVGTARGLYYLQPPTPGRPPVFGRVAGMPSNCQCLLSTGDSLLVGTSRGVFQVEHIDTGTNGDNVDNNDYAVRQIDGVPVIQVFALAACQTLAHRVWVAAESGLLSIRRQNPQAPWRLECQCETVGQGILSIAESKNNPGILWLGTKSNGTIKVKPGNNPCQPEIQKFGADRGLPPGEIQVAEAGGEVRFATSKGLFRLDKTTRTFVPDPLLGDEFAGRQRNVFRLVEDQNKRIWFHSSKENFYATPGSGGTFTVDGIPFSRISRVQVHAIYPDGAFTWFATSKKLICYHASAKKDYQIPFPVLIRKVTIKGRSSFYDWPGSSTFTPRLPDLPYKDRHLEFQAAAPFFEDESKTRYRYLLEGYDSGWSDWTTTTTRRYTNMDLGHHSLRVQAMNVYGTLSSETVLSFRILPPWYLTWWAYLLYGAAAFFMVYLVVRWRSRKLLLEKQKLEHIVEERTCQVNQANLQLRQKTTQLEEQSVKLKEMDQIKSRFFANISHEFRTPLTLIMGPLEQIRAESRQLSGRSKEEKSGRETGENKNLEKWIDMVDRNARRLLGLINQLLDLSKLESGKMKLQAMEINLVTFLKGILEPFQLAAARDGTELVFFSAGDSLFLYLDPEKLEKIMANLLSNALKFTPAGGKITVSVTPAAGSDSENPVPAGPGQYVYISVKDNGIGIPGNQLPHIFERFYQAETTVEHRRKGSGIGLALVKELVELHHGQVSINSRKGENSGTELILRFPMGKGHLAAEELAAGEESELYRHSLHEPRGTLLLTPEDTEPAEAPGVPGDAGNRRDREPHQRQEDLTEQVNPGDRENQDNGACRENEKNIILVVEDNADFRYYIRTRLEPDYTVFEAGNGREGLEKAVTIIPDLIISDIMMPGMDGYELCREVKSHVNTSHIPVVLLTAKAAEENILQGLETGADDYITKPFNSKLLCARIRNLIDLRRQMQLNINREMILQPSRLGISKLDREFLQDLQKAIRKNISEPDLNVESLSKQLYMSRTTLYRKIQALSGESPTDFIRSYRLKRAAQLLKANFGSVTEVAFEVGFTSRAYFTKCFKEKFHQLPSEYLSRESPEL
jgi:signal transduction histidine kinase/DNA-binding response OmpR family regulator